MTVKESLADFGVAVAEEWCQVNGIRTPKFNIYKDKSHKRCQLIERIGTCGYYRTDNIYVGVPLCAHLHPSYSWPGFISDRTPYGVIQHELGHHVDEIKSGFDIYRTRRGFSTPVQFSDLIRDKSGEKPITSYSPNTQEWFAEIFRLFVTNPNLLLAIRPKAYKAMIEAGLKPTTGDSAMDVMKSFNAPPKIYERMDNWIKNQK